MPDCPLTREGAFVMSRAGEIITEWKPHILFLVIGLVLGPFISSWLGWQVTAGTMNSAVQDAVIEYRADLCTKRAQADPETTPAVLGDWSSRGKIAEKWAVLPGEEESNRDVVNRCSSRLTP